MHMAALGGVGLERRRTRRPTWKRVDVLIRRDALCRVHRQAVAVAQKKATSAAIRELRPGDVPDHAFPVAQEQPRLVPAQNLDDVAVVSDRGPAAVDAGLAE